MDKPIPRTHLGILVMLEAHTEAFSSQIVKNHSRLTYVYSPAAIVLCLLIITLSRLT